MNDLDILGFNPQDLFVKEETPHSSGNQYIYKPRPADSILLQEAGKRNALPFSTVIRSEPYDGGKMHYKFT